MGRDRGQLFAADWQTDSARDKKMAERQKNKNVLQLIEFVDVLKESIYFK